MQTLISNAIGLGIFLIFGFACWYMYMRIAGFPILCPGKKILKKNGYGIKYVGNNENVPGVSTFDYIESVMDHPKIWEIFKKMDGERVVVGRILAVYDNKTFFQTYSNLAASRFSNDFLKAMKEISAESI